MVEWKTDIVSIPEQQKIKLEGSWNPNDFPSIFQEKRITLWIGVFKSGT